MFSKLILFTFVTVVPIGARPAPMLFGDAITVLEENPSRV